MTKFIRRLFAAKPATKPVATKATLGLESLDAREMPAGIGHALSHMMSSIAHTISHQSSISGIVAGNSNLPSLSSLLAGFNAKK